MLQKHTGGEKIIRLIPLFYLGVLENAAYLSRVAVSLDLSAEKSKGKVGNWTFYSVSLKLGV